MSLVFLVGMPASGKSYWGETFAKAYNLNFIDTDIYISEKKSKTIARIFEDDGEEEFRALETQVLKEIIETHDNKSIIATGGGIVLSSENIKLMQENGCIVYLETPIYVLNERLEKVEDERPLFNNVNNIQALLVNLYKERKSLYEKANYIFEYKKISVVNFEEILNKCIDRHLQ